MNALVKHNMCWYDTRLSLDSISRRVHPICVSFRTIFRVSLRQYYEGFISKTVFKRRFVERCCLSLPQLSASTHFGCNKGSPDTEAWRIQNIYNKRTWFWRCFKNRHIFCSRVKGLLPTTQVRIRTQFFLAYLMGHRLGAPTVLM